MLTVIVHLQSIIVTRAQLSTRDRAEAGQSTAEYALVLLGVAALALLVLAWASKTDRIGKLFDFVLDQIVGRVK